MPRYSDDFLALVYGGYDDSTYDTTTPTLDAEPAPAEPAADPEPVVPANDDVVAAPNEPAEPTADPFAGPATPAFDPATTVVTTAPPEDGRPAADPFAGPATPAFDAANTIVTTTPPEARPEPETRVGPLMTVFGVPIGERHETVDPQTGRVTFRDDSVGLPFGLGNLYTHRQATYQDPRSGETVTSTYWNAGPATGSSRTVEGGPSTTTGLGVNLGVVGAGFDGAPRFGEEGNPTRYYGNVGVPALAGVAGRGTSYEGGPTTWSGEVGALGTELYAGGRVDGENVAGAVGIRSGVPIPGETNHGHAALTYNNGELGVDIKNPEALALGVGLTASGTPGIFRAFRPAGAVGAADDALFMAQRGTPHDFAPRTPGLATEMTAAEFRAMQPIPGVDGVRITGGPVKAQDLMAASEANGIEYALARRGDTFNPNGSFNTADGSWYVYSGGGTRVGIPTDARPILHTHPNVEAATAPWMASAEDLASLQRSAQRMESLYESQYGAALPARAVPTVGTSAFVHASPDMVAAGYPQSAFVVPYRLHGAF